MGWKTSRMKNDSQQSRALEAATKDIQAYRALVAELKQWLSNTEQEHLQTAKRIGGMGGGLLYTSARAYEMTRVKLMELETAVI